MTTTRGEKVKRGKRGNPTGAQDGIGRRDFLKRGLTAAAGVFLSSAAYRRALAAAGADIQVPPPTQPQPPSADMPKPTVTTGVLPKRPLGKTGLMVSVIAYGGAPLYEHDPRNPVPEETVSRMLSRAIERDLNFIDLSHLYGRGYVEKVFGKALRGRRDKIVIFSRCPLGVGRPAGKMIDESLQRLETDHIDIYGMHGTWMSEDTADRFIESILPDLEKAKQAGKIGHIATTCHQAPTAMLKIVESGKVEVIQVPINPVWREFLEIALPAAEKRGVGVVAMKPLWRGRLLSNLPELNSLLGPTRKEKLASNLSFSLSQKIASVSIGFVFEPEIDEDIDVALNFLRPGGGFSEEQAKLLRPKAHESVKQNCRVCNHCLPCPARIDVPQILRLELYARHYGLVEWAKAQYQRLATKADQCTKCGSCTKRCPYGIPAQELILQSAKQLSATQNISQ